MPRPGHYIHGVQTRCACCGYDCYQTGHCPCCRTAAVDTGHTATMWPNPTPH